MGNIPAIALATKECKDYTDCKEYTNYNENRFNIAVQKKNIDEIHNILFELQHKPKYHPFDISFFKNNNEHDQTLQNQLLQNKIKLYLQEIRPQHRLKTSSPQTKT